ncbi:hypothetical protein ASF60_13035 [Methylobacterium sp. Leaf113]|nr:hypothetical protein ASF60_13035 [Methylobacterium sp. Leaf113]
MLDKIVENARRNHTADLSEEERALANEFLMFQMKRVPDFFKQVAVDAEGQIETYIAKFEADGGKISESEKASLRDPAFVKRAVQNARVYGVGRQSDRILSAFAAKGLTVAHISPNEGSFILGSHPTARYAAPDGRKDLGHPDVELWLPVASDVAITLYGESGTESLVKLNNAGVTKINKTIFDQSTVVASGARSVLDALIGS